MLLTSAGLNLRPPGLQSDPASNWATEAGSIAHCFHSQQYIDIIVIYNNNIIPLHLSYIFHF